LDAKNIHPRNSREPSRRAVTVTALRHRDGR